MDETLDHSDVEVQDEENSYEEAKEDPEDKLLKVLSKMKVDPKWKCLLTWGLLILKNRYIGLEIWKNILIWSILKTPKG